MILKLEDLKKEIGKRKFEGKKIVFTNGCFDILHAGHVTYLAKAKELGDLLVLGLNSDESVKRLKGPERPINSQNDRAIVMDALKSIDYVVSFEEDTPLNIVKEIMPDVIVKGGDYKKEDVIGGKEVADNGGEIVIIPFLDGRSTTNVIEKIKDK